MAEPKELVDKLDQSIKVQSFGAVVARPWLDGPTALAAVLARTGEMALATTVALPVVRERWRRAWPP